MCGDGDRRAAVGRTVSPPGRGVAALTARGTPQSALAVEASTPTWHVADGVAPAVGDLRIVDPLKTTLKAGYAAKTDRLEARRLADALRRDRVVGIYYPPLAIRALRERCRHRHALVRVRTAVINRLRAVRRRQGLSDARRLATTADDRWLEPLALPPCRRECGRAAPGARDRPHADPAARHRGAARRRV